MDDDDESGLLPRRRRSARQVVAERHDEPTPEEVSNARKVLDALSMPEERQPLG